MVVVVVMVVVMMAVVMGGNVKQATAGSECVTIYRLQAYNRKDGRAGR